MIYLQQAYYNLKQLFFLLGKKIKKNENYN